MTNYPTGVEKHNGKLRIWFMYKGDRVRESLSVEDTAKNRVRAGELRASVCFEIKMGTFNYATRFPESPNLKKFGGGSRDITVQEIADKWLSLKELEIAKSTMDRYESKVRNTIPFIGGGRLAASVRQEEILAARKELLTGYQHVGRGHKTTRRGRSVATVNDYMGVIVSIFGFALANGYVSTDPTAGISPLTKSRTIPDPLSKAEFVRMLEAINIRQTRNLWAIAVYTGLRHGELCALAWEDVDLTAGTLIVSRNLAHKGEFTPPKTESGNRTIQLIQPAIEAFRDQAELSRLGKAHDVSVALREYGKTTTHKCTFVFNPQLSAVNSRSGPHYSDGTISQSWDSALRRAGIRHRKAYQSRHTYACWSLSAGANPNFIAQQMGHASAQMVYQVYGSWMSENNSDQIALLNQKLSGFAPAMPPSKTGT